MDKKVTPILMPQAGQSMEEGTILSWKAKIGDKIAVGQIIFEIETDKATLEVEAADAGRLAKIVTNPRSSRVDNPEAGSPVVDSKTVLSTSPGIITPNCLPNSLTLSSILTPSPVPDIPKS